MTKPHRYVSTYLKTDDTIIYRVLNDYHRCNGPAVAISGRYSWTWYLFNKYHRYYGQARSAGEWYIHGKLVK